MLECEGRCGKVEERVVYGMSVEGVCWSVRCGDRYVGKCVGVGGR